MENLNLDSLTESHLDNMETLQVIGAGGRGPLMSIPSNICRFKRLKVNINK